MTAWERDVHAASASERFETWRMPKYSDRPGVKRPEGRAPGISTVGTRIKHHSVHSNRLTSNFADGSIGVVAAPDPHQRVRQSLLENFAVAMPRIEAENETVIVTLGFKGGRRALAGHHPVVLGSFRIVFAQVVFGHVREDAQRFLPAGFNQFHSGMVFPRAERVFG